ncbi:MAG: alpha/beta hydrolase [Phycisphaerales bacterium]|nr:alpha/beta hydrolase [Phycisphaerales bacterium]
MDAKAKRSWKQRLRSWLIALVVIYAAWAIVVYAIQTRLLFPTYMIAARPPFVPPAGGGVEVVGVTGPEGVIETIVMRPTNGRAAEPGPVVIVFHGNAELARDGVGSRLEEHLRSRGITVVAPEYRGYGTMAGSPGQKEIGDDMVAVADWVAKQPWCDQQRVVYFGWSVGGGVACQLATAREPSGGMILQSTFTSVASFAGGFAVPVLLVKHPFRNDRVLESLDAPVLIVHGVNDSIVPVEHGRSLARIARHGEYVELAGDHFHDWADWGAYLGAIDRWLTARGM